MKKLVFLFVISVFIFTGCATQQVSKKVTIDTKADPKTSFSGYKSYTWLGSAGVLNDPEGKWKRPGFDIEKEIRFLIDRELRKRGLSESSNSPDMAVAYAIGVDMNALKVRENPETKQQITTHVPQGELVIILVDPRTEFVIWVGKASAEVREDADDQQARQRLDYVVTEMIRRLPK
jgi:hypothetical protein